MKQTIQVIKGDTLNLKVSVPSSQQELIDKVLFSSYKLGIEQELVKVENESGIYWLLTIKDTSSLSQCYATFDITMILSNGDKETVVHNGDFNILPKENEINGN